MHLSEDTGITHTHTTHAMSRAFPPSGLRDMIDKTAKYVGRNGDEFAKVIREKHPADQRYEFLLPWNTLHKYGIAHQYFINRSCTQQYCHGFRCLV